MPTVELSEQNVKLLKAVLKHGFSFPVMINSSFAPPKTIDEVIHGLCIIADDEGYINLDWE